MRTLGNVVKTVSVSFAVSLMLNAPAWAGLCSFVPRLCGGGGPTPAPEIDPNLLRGTVAVLAGGVLMLAGRRRRR